MIILSKKDCYCSIENFYKNVLAKILIFPDEGIQFDITKIHVSHQVRYKLWQFYMQEKRKTFKPYSVNLYEYMPKADLEYDGFAAELEEGFISKKKLITLTKGDCYCDLVAFFENVARKMGVTTEGSTKISFNKIRITRRVLDELWEYQRKYPFDHKKKIRLAICLEQFAPKAILEYDGYVAEVEEGFIK